MKNVRSLIRTVPDFPKPGINFRDITPLLEDVQAFQYVIHQFACAWYGKVDRIAVLEARGFLFGTPLALAMGLPLALVRKKGKLPGKTLSVEYGLEYGKDVVEMHEDAVKPGERVLVVDDLLATGGTAKAACTLIERAGGTVVGCAFVVELAGLPGREVLAQYPVQVLEVFDA
jgi:adenine phosphoribosyltransferase